MPRSSSAMRSSSKRRPAASRKRRSAGSWDAHQVLVGVDAGPSVTDVREQRCGAIEVDRIGDARLERRAAELGLQLRRGSLGDYAAGIDDDDLVSQVLRLFHVLGGEQHGRAVVDEFLYESPRRRCGCAGQDPWSARRGKARRAGRSGSRRCQAAGASRPSTS